MLILSKVAIKEQDIIEALDYDDAAKLIKAIDLSVADYDFTWNLAKYLIQELADECAAGGEEFNLDELAPNA